MFGLTIGALVFFGVTIALRFIYKDRRWPQPIAMPLLLVGAVGLGATYYLHFR